jgi:L-cysteine S-thiosulfotransferase
LIANTLPADDVYALTAYILTTTTIVARDFVTDRTACQLEMSSHDNFIRVAASGATEMRLQVPTVSAPLTRLALRTAALVVMATSPAGAQSGPADGQKLAFDRGKGNCLTCHEISGGDLPGTIGPKLENIKSKYPDRGDLVAILTDETKRNPQTVMPPFGRNRILTEQEINAIFDFLQTL